MFLRFLNNHPVLYLLFYESLTAAGRKPFSFLLQLIYGSRFFLKKNPKLLLIKLEDFKGNCEVAPPRPEKEPVGISWMAVIHLP